MVIIKRRVRAMTLDRPFSTFQELVHVSWRELADSTALGENKKLSVKGELDQQRLCLTPCFSTRHSTLHSNSTVEKGLDI